jgi:DNA-binding HxlR family transcriptional regulator
MSEYSTLNTGCVSAASAILGTKWTALLLRNLAEGPQRFRDFERANPGLNPRTLTARLDELIRHGIIEITVSPNQPHKFYQLTPKGHDLVPILEAMTIWGAKYPLARVNLA